MKMDSKMKSSGRKNPYLKLSLKKNKEDVTKTSNRSSDVILLDESSDKLQIGGTKTLLPVSVVCSPIVVNDSSILSDDDLPEISIPCKNGNVSFNCSKESPHLDKKSRPSIGGWSPMAQPIITANPKKDRVPSTPKDKANESFEKCSMKTIEKSQKKILNDLYGNTWKSIPSLFRTISRNCDNFNGISKKLFDDDDDKENVKNIIKRDKELYFKVSDLRSTDKKVQISSEVKNKVTDFGDTDKKCKKRLYTEKVPCTPDLPKLKTKANSTTKKVKIKKGMSVTELVEIMRKNDENDKSIDIAEDSKNKLENNKTLSTNKNDFTKDNRNNLTNKANFMNGINNLNNKVNLTENGNNLSIKEKKTKKDKSSNKNSVSNDNASNGSTDKSENISEGKKNKNVDILTKKIETVSINSNSNLKRLSFVGSLADNVPSWRCHPEAFQYIDNYKDLREKLSRRLFEEFNRDVFGDSMPADLAIVWDSKFRSTAGTTTNRQLKNAKGDRIRSSMIKLSTKVVDTPQRLRDTLIHELCHVATWLIDAELRAGHGPLWKKWVKRALLVFPELGEITRCHDIDIHFKYIFRCTQCGYSIQRHSKSIDTEKKCCGYCRGRFEIVLNKKNKDGVVVRTPAKKATSGFALFVKENYASFKDGSKTHAQVMKLLGEEYAVEKSKKKEEG